MDSQDRIFNDPQGRGFVLLSLVSRGRIHVAATDADGAIALAGLEGEELGGAIRWLLEHAGEAAWITDREPEREGWYLTRSIFGATCGQWKRGAWHRPVYVDVTGWMPLPATGEEKYEPTDEELHGEEPGPTPELDRLAEAALSVTLDGAEPEPSARWPPEIVARSASTAAISARLSSTGRIWVSLDDEEDGSADLEIDPDEAARWGADLVALAQRAAGETESDRVSGEGAEPPRGIEKPAGPSTKEIENAGKAFILGAVSDRLKGDAIRAAAENVVDEFRSSVADICDHLARLEKSFREARRGADADLAAAERAVEKGKASELVDVDGEKVTPEALAVLEAVASSGKEWVPFSEIVGILMARGVDHSQADCLAVGLDSLGFLLSRRREVSDYSGRLYSLTKRTGDWLLSREAGDEIGSSGQSEEQEIPTQAVCHGLAPGSRLAANLAPSLERVYVFLAPHGSAEEVDVLLNLDDAIRWAQSVIEIAQWHGLRHAGR